MMGRDRPVLAPLSADAKQLYGAIRAKGYSGFGTEEDLRDAVHEAHHALFCKLKKPWTRDNIHDAIVRRAKRDASRLLRSTEYLVQYELHARAVEWTLCERYGVAYEVEHWADITWWETIKNMNIKLPDVGQIVEAIKAVKGSRRIETSADDVAALATTAVKTTKRKRAS